MIGHSFLTLNRLSSIVFSGSGATSECFAVSSLSCRQRSCIACWSPPRNHLAFHLCRISSESICSVSSQDDFKSSTSTLLLPQRERHEEEVLLRLRFHIFLGDCWSSWAASIYPFERYFSHLLSSAVFTRFLFDYRGYHYVYMWPVNFLLLLVCLGSKCWSEWHCNIIHIIRT